MRRDPGRYPIRIRIRMHDLQHGHRLAIYVDREIRVAITVQCPHRRVEAVE